MKSKYGGLIVSLQPKRCSIAGPESSNWGDGTALSNAREDGELVSEGPREAAYLGLFWQKLRIR